MPQSRVAAFLAVLILAALVFLTGSLAESRDQGIIRIFAKQRAVVLFDQGLRGKSAGDHELSSFRLEDKPGHAIGFATFTCTSFARMLSGMVSQCAAVFVMPRGRIVASGSRQTRDHYVLAVTGGTGLYEGSGGAVLGALYDRNPRRERLIISLI